MTQQTVRDIVQADIDKLQAAADTAIAELAAAKAKLAATHPTLLAVLERPVEEVVAFFRSFGAHIFQHPATQAAVAVAAHAEQSAAQGSAAA